MANFDYNTVISLVVNLGAVIYIAKRTIDKVDGHDVLLPKIIEAIDNITKGSKETLDAIGDLYDKHNVLSDEFHELRGEHNARACAAKEQAQKTRLIDRASSPKMRSDDVQLSED